MLAALRTRMTARIHQVLPGSTGGIASALITGDRGAISDEDEQALRDAGLAHVLAIAGLHMALVGLGLYGLVANPQPLRKILAFNLMGSGVFLVFGIVARKGAAAGLQADPVPQAMVITGIVVAFAASALAVALVLRLFEETGRATLSPDAWTNPRDDGAGSA